jgi:hypothetical protein
MLAFREVAQGYPVRLNVIRRNNPGLNCTTIICMPKSPVSPKTRKKARREALRAVVVFVPVQSELASQKPANPPEKGQNEAGPVGCWYWW